MCLNPVSARGSLWLKLRKKLQRKWTREKRRESRWSWLNPEKEAERVSKLLLVESRKEPSLACLACLVLPGGTIGSTVDDGSSRPLCRQQVHAPHHSHNPKQRLPALTCPPALNDVTASKVEIRRTRLLLLLTLGKGPWHRMKTLQTAVYSLPAVVFLMSCEVLKSEQPH